MDDRLTGLLHGLVWNAAAPPDVLVRPLGLEDEWVRWVVPRTPGCGEAPRSAPPRPSAGGHAPAAGPGERAGNPGE
ncbi:hypothetical protein ACFV4Q_23805 [Streptomyces nojiriensis]|uniref:hypothetical protein n=1 Tax=Streptomyces nojiriensis TaxID=66374 RepID=UPI003665A1CA